MYSVILGLIPYVVWYFFSWLGYVLESVVWIFAIIAIVMGFKWKTFRIPGVGKLADK